MKAAVLRKIGQPFVLEDVPMPEIRPDEVLVETRTCGICRTDLHIQDGFAATAFIAAPAGTRRRCTWTGSSEAP